MEHVEPERTEPTWSEKQAAEQRSTPLTGEAITHVRAAAGDADDAFATMREMVQSAIAPLTEANRHVGFDLKLTDDEVCRIVWALEGALEFGYARVVEPIYARGRGQRPHARSESCPPMCHHRRDDRNGMAVVE